MYPSCVVLKERPPLPDFEDKRRFKSPLAAEKFFRRVQRKDVSRVIPIYKHERAMGFAAWILIATAGPYMALFADFGEQEHVFTPLRKRFEKFRNSLFTLSPAERAALGLDVPSPTSTPAAQPLNDGRPS